MQYTQHSLKLFLFIVLSLFAVFNTQLTHAQSDPCEFDRQKYCPTYRADDPRRLYCLKGLESQIKPSCKAALKNVPGTEGEFIDECIDDYRKFCGDIPPGKGKILKCLKENSKNLNFECRKKVSIFPNPK